MKKLIALAVTGVMLLSPLSAFAFEPITAFNDDELSMTIDDIQVVKDHDGNNAVAIIMTYTNTGAEPKSAMSTMLYNAYQGGKQLEFTYADSDNKVEVEGDSYTEVFDGASVQFAQYYVLQSDNPEIKFQASSFHSDGDMLTLSLDDAGLESETEPDYEQMYNDLLVKYNALLEKYGETE
jgi:hypothetical protein